MNKICSLSEKASKFKQIIVLLNRLTMSVNCSCKKINGEPAICVQGTWNKRNEWDETADTKALIWSNDQITLSIIQSGLGYFIMF